MRVRFQVFSVDFSLLVWTTEVCVCGSPVLCVLTFPRAEELNWGGGKRLKTSKVWKEDKIRVGHEAMTVEPQ